MKFILATVAILTAALISLSAAEEPTVETAKYWEIAGPADKVTWIEIHSFQKIDNIDVAHIEVLSRKKDSKPWEFEHLLPHLAITVDALKKSVLRPLKVHSVYPESYESDYNLWKKQFDEGNAVVCKTSISDALSAAK
jgi:hypothetical protein